LAEPGVGDVEAAHLAALGLQELVAIHRVVEVVGEVVVQGQIRAYRIGVRFGQRIGAAAAPFGGEAVARGAAAVAGVDRAVVVQAAILHGAQWHLAGGVPGAL
nr:hypothetical protein [Tanacetum cinerariifolium]